MLTESTKLPFGGMSETQPGHGYKGTAENALLIVINPTKGILYHRTKNLMNTLIGAGAQVFQTIKALISFECLNIGT